MTDREKLIELCDTNNGWVDEVPAEKFADYLLSHGVTFATDTNVGGKWIPVTERLPEICGMPVLMVAVNWYGEQKVVKGFTNYEYPVDFLTNEKEYDNCWGMWLVTHWMPLPEPPEMKG